MCPALLGRRTGRRSPVAGAWSPVPGPPPVRVIGGRRREVRADQGGYRRGVTVDDDCGPGARSTGPDESFLLDRAVASIYADLRLTPMLHALLARTRELVGGVAGSISVIDRDAGTYRKVAERGISCQVGRTFSLSEGATGRAVDRGSPVVIDDYSAIVSRHLPPAHPANRGSVAAVPIWWRGELIGVNVAFTGRPQRFTAAEVDRLEVLTQTAAGAIVTAGVGDPSLARLLDRSGDAPGRSVQRPLEDDGVPPLAPSGADRLGSGARIDAAVERGTGDTHRADHGGGPGRPSPLTARETEVMALVARGLGDREIARRLVLSPKTVEKHVGSAIRKTGSASRTGAAVLGLERGWIRP